jgi:hypothetical protein
VQDLIEQLWYCALTGCVCALALATTWSHPVRLRTSSVIPRLLFVGVPAYLGINYLLYQETLPIVGAGTSFVLCLYWLHDWWLPRHRSGGDLQRSICGDCDWPDSASSSVVVGSGADVLENELGSRPLIEGMAHSWGQAALAGNLHELCRTPDPELVDPSRGFAGDIALDLAESTEPIASLLGDGRASVMALEPGGPPPVSCLTMAGISHVCTLARVAQILGEDEDWLNDISIEMSPEDGIISVYGPGDDYTPAFTDRGIENLRQIVETHKENSQHRASTKGHEAL